MSPNLEVAFTVIATVLILSVALGSVPSLALKVLYVIAALAG